MKTRRHSAQIVGQPILAAAAFPGGFFDGFRDFLPGERRLKSRLQAELPAPHDSHPA
jgi:hypothetical protein